MLEGARVLLIVAGGIAAYKSLELVRRLRDRGARVRCVLTRAGAEFVTPLSLAALSGEPVFSELFSLKDESEMGHIRLSREADLVVVAAATADLMAKMAAGIADDLASAILLATDKPVLVAPAMNVRMWHHPAMQRNLARLKDDGIAMIGPAVGPLADGEHGEGRLAEPPDMVAAIEAKLGVAAADWPMSGRRALVTSGPTFEAIDPVRYLANRSSGKQGHAIAGALVRLGAATTLVSGPTSEPDPAGVRMVRVESAAEMLRACRSELPVDVAVCAAAVADWRPERRTSTKLKKGSTSRKGAGNGVATLRLVENPDILAGLSRRINDRPTLVVGFAAETGNLIENATVKRGRKGCDWILANNVGEASSVLGGDDNTVHLVTAAGVEAWPTMSKRVVAERLAERIAEYFEHRPDGR